MTYKNTARAIYLLLAVIVAGGALLAFWEFQPSEVFKVSSQISVKPPQTMAGGIVQLSLDYCKLQGVEGQIRTSYVSSSKEVFQPLSSEKGDVGCHDNVSLPVIIPKDLSPDTYYIKFRVTYQINPLKSVTEEFRTEEFQIQ